MNRIQIMVHDEAAQFYYSETIDDAVKIMDENEIAVVFMPYGLDVLSGDEMLQIILDHNDRAQIILLFEEEDLLNVVHAHNAFHICRLICTNNMKLELLPEKISAAFDRYNKDDDLREFERDYRLKEDKYKNALREMSGLLNDRMECYGSVRNMLLTLIGSYDKLPEKVRDRICEYFGIILQDYMTIHLLEDQDPQNLLLETLARSNRGDEHRHLMIACDHLKDLTAEQQKQALFVIRFLSAYFSGFYDRYRGRIETEQNDDGIILNIVYESIPYPETAQAAIDLLPVNEALVKQNADRFAAGSKERVLQYKMFYKKADT
ncbi:MAG: hypothetical protein J5518_07370 [Lachnospiraceae bacterium]|nr:hypothetical protein [Lachnospiraceae bacterium]